MNAEELAWHHPRKIGPWLSVAERVLISGVPLAVIGWIIKYLCFNPDLKMVSDDDSIWALGMGFFGLLGLAFSTPLLEVPYALVRPILGKTGGAQWLYDLDCRRRAWRISGDTAYFSRQYFALIATLVILFSIPASILGYGLVLKKGVPIWGGLLMAIVGILIPVIVAWLPARSASRNDTSYRLEASKFFLKKRFAPDELPSIGSPERRRVIIRSLIGMAGFGGITTMVSFAPGKLSRCGLFFGTFVLACFHSIWTAVKYEK